MLIGGPSVNSHWAGLFSVLPTERCLVSELMVCPPSCKNTEVWRKAPWGRSMQFSARSVLVSLVLERGLALSKSFRLSPEPLES